MIGAFLFLSLFQYMDYNNDVNTDKASVDTVAVELVAVVAFKSPKN